MTIWKVVVVGNLNQYSRPLKDFGIGWKMHHTQVDMNLWIFTLGPFRLVIRHRLLGLFYAYTFIQDDDYTQIVGVSVLDSNRPIITLLDGMIKQTIFYIDFKDTPPPKGSFDVPSICSKDGTRMESPPVHTSIFNSFPSQKWIKNTITGNYEDSIHPMVHKILDKVMQH